MAGNVKNMGLTSLDDLFKSEEERQQDSRERILNIPIEELHPYARQRETAPQTGRAARIFLH